MTSLTGPALLPPLLTTYLAPANTGTPIVLDLLAARALDQLETTLLGTLEAAAGPGKIISGLVESKSPDGIITITARNGTLITLPQPPEVPLEPGDAVVLRLIATEAVPQAILLAVNGRPVAGAPAATPVEPPPAAETPAPSASSPVPTRLGGPPALPALGPAGLAASFIAAISLADEIAIEAALDPDEFAIGNTPTEPIGPSVVAVLIRPAPAKLGQLPVPSGTRYAVTLRNIGEVDSESPSATTGRPAPSSPLPSIATVTRPGPLGPIGPVPLDAAASQPLAAPEAPSEIVAAPIAQPVPTTASAPPATIAMAVAALPDQPGSVTSPPEETSIDSEFTAQISLLAGRVAASGLSGEILVETALGTLALPASVTLRPGTAIQLRITSVAPPRPAPASTHPVAAPPVPPDDAARSTLLEDLAQALAPSGPGQVAEIRQILAVQPGDGLAAAIVNFLAGLRPEAQSRSAEIPSRKLLLAGGNKALAARIDRASTEIGQIRPAPDPNGWTVTILPFLGTASLRPMRLYRKQQRDQDASAAAGTKSGKRFMLEVELKRLGPLQFDGLVRERRFDLLIRSAEPLASGLQTRVDQVFQDGLRVAGWHGQIGFGRIGRFPEMPDPAGRAHFDLGA